MIQTGGVCPNAGQGLINSTTTYEDCFLNLGPPSPTVRHFIMLPYSLLQITTVHMHGRMDAQRHPLAGTCML